MGARITLLHAVLNLNTRLFHSCLQDVDDGAARKRFEGANNIAFIAAHLVDARRFLGEYLGISPGLLPAELLTDAHSIEDVQAYPSLEWLKAAWQSVSRSLSERFSGLSEEELAAASPRSFPLEEGTVLGGIAFMLQHESYHIGQISLLRRLLGLGPMSYF